MFMRYLGGGVGHRGIGIDVETSRQHALRARRRRPRRKEATSGARITGLEADHSSDEDRYNDSDTDSGSSEYEDMDHNDLSDGMFSPV